MRSISARLSSARGSRELALCGFLCALLGAQACTTPPARREDTARPRAAADAKQTPLAKAEVVHARISDEPAADAPRVAEQEVLGDLPHGDSDALQARATGEPPPPRKPAARSEGALRASHGPRVRRALTTLGFGHGGGSLGTLGAAVGEHADAPRGRSVGSSAGAPLTAASSVARTERYAHTGENAFEHVADQALSTFSIDVDTASYTNVRRFLRDGAHPPVDAVRIEEMLSYFRYDYPVPRGAAPVAVSTEVSEAPWSSTHRLVRIGLRTAPIAREDAPATSLVFLVDVSGSMRSADKLPLLKQGLTLISHNLRDQDRVALVVYAGASGVVLPPTSGRKRAEVLEALARLEAGGSTNGADGIRLAYEVAKQSYIPGGNNRVILATDGDFNVGTTSEGELVRLIEDKRKSGIFLTVLGFGRGNLNDSGMEALADHGNGNYAYIDSIAEAHKVLVREAGSTLTTVAKDVKLQIEWNPLRVASYRLIGFENRMLAARDFNDDQKDAGELGAGHCVTALYEVVPSRGQENRARDVDALRYQSPPTPNAAAASDELMTIKLRYKRPGSDASQLLTHAVRDAHGSLEGTSNDFRWAAAVAGFGLVLRDSPHKGTASLDLVRTLGQSALGADLHGERRELLGLVEQARALRVGERSVATRGVAAP